MARYRQNLPQLDGRILLTDGGLETFMIFQERVELPLFVAFDLMRSEEGRARLRAYFNPYIAIAKRAGTGLLLESPTWRASADWGSRLGLPPDDIGRINRESIAFLQEIRDAHETAATPMVISGCIGPRGDGYDPGTLMTADEAETYHAHQIGTLAETEADLVSALTQTNVPEAIGVARAARSAGVRVAVSFTVETDGRLPTGDRLADAVAAVDDATGGYPAYFMINCAHPAHFAHVLGGVPRIRGLRANASRCSHAELDGSETLDTGDPDDLGRRFGELMRAHPQLTVLGGCCGTDHRHIGKIGRAVEEALAAA